ncbi:hypothetical protein JCM1841_000499 [Sporobolomyces salmonicolor]
MPPPLPGELVHEILRLSLLAQPYLSTTLARPALIQHVVIGRPKQARLFCGMVERSQLVGDEALCGGVTAQSLAFVNWMGRITSENIVSVMQVCSSIEEMRVHHVAGLHLELSVLVPTGEWPIRLVLVIDSG